MQLRKELACILTLVLLTLSAGCTKTPPKPAPAPAAAKATIRLLEVGTDPVTESIISAYMEKYPNDRVEKRSLTEDDWQGTVESKIEDGQADIVPMINAKIMVQKRLVLALSPYVKSSHYDLAPYGPGLDQLRRNGELYELPQRVAPMVLIYNRDLFKAGVGLSAPPANWTWEQFRDLAGRLTHGDGEQRVWGFAAPRAEQIVTARVDQATRGARAPDPALVRSTLQFFSTMLFQDRSMRPAEPRTLGKVHEGSLFAEGRAAMTIDSLSFLRFMGPTWPFQYDVAPFPALPGATPTLTGFPTTYGIAATTQNPEAAWRFLTFMTGSEGSAISARVGNLPAYTADAVKQAWFERKPAPPPGTAILFETPWTAPASWGGTTLAKTNQLLVDAANQMLSGQKSYEQAAADYEQGYQQIMADR